MHALGWPAYFLGQRNLLQNVLVAVPPEVLLADAFSFALPILVFALYRVINAKELKKLEKPEPSEASRSHASGLLLLASFFLAVVSIAPSLMHPQGGPAPSSFLLVAFVLLMASAPSLITACIAWVNPSPSREFVRVQTVFVGIHLIAVLLWIVYISVT